MLAQDHMIGPIGYPCGQLFKKFLILRFKTSLFQHLIQNRKVCSIERRQSLSSIYGKTILASYRSLSFVFSLYSRVPSNNSTSIWFVNDTRHLYCNAYALTSQRNTLIFIGEFVLFCYVHVFFFFRNICTVSNVESDLNSMVTWDSIICGLNYTLR